MIIAPTYSREVINHFRSAPKTHRCRDLLLDIANEIEHSEKFILPQGGRFVDDPDYKAIDKGQELHLPFDRVVLEFKPAFTHFKPESGNVKHEKTLVLCAETELYIQFSPICFYNGYWVVAPPAFLNKRTALLGDKNPSLGTRRPIEITLEASNPTPIDDYLDEAISIVSMINALACKNVAIHKEKCSRYSKARMQAKDCDEYHMLVLTNSSGDEAGVTNGGIRRGVREHLRRGHVRICASGVKTWVNAAVIAKGSGGKVTKDYRLK